MLWNARDSSIAHRAGLGAGCLGARQGLTFAPHRTMSVPIPPASEQNDETTDAVPGAPAERAAEIGGRASGLDPTRYGDWEKNGRCIDF